MPQDGAGSTFGNDDKLPRVPLPTLEETCERFVEWCAPLLTDDERIRTEAAVHAYLGPGSPAHTLHAALEKFDAREDVHSWLDEFWPTRYLGRRDRIALNANFTFLLPPAGHDQLRRAAALIIAALHVKDQLDSETFPPMVPRGQPQSMDQFRYLFSTTRIPGLVQDTVRAPYSETEPGPAAARHVLVFVRGNLFRLDVVGPGGVPHSLDELVDGLRAAVAAGATPAPAGTSVGQLTTLARADWARRRAELLACEPGNAAVLDQVEAALFCVCLDDVSPAGDLDAADHLLHGQSENRWFDKALSFIVFADGTAGVNVEHCLLDGTTILGLIDAMAERTAEQHAEGAGARAQGAPALAPLSFVLDDDLQAHVREAGESFAAFAADTASTTLPFADFGSQHIKRLGMSPDAFVQMAYQLAHHRTAGFVGATYESIATRQYRRGRTEAMRVVTPEVVAFVNAMSGPGTDEPARRAAFRAAAEAHVARAKACQAGDAPEQHLWELQLIARRRGDELGVTGQLPLYDSPGWTIMRDDYLSTSSAPSRNIRYFGFGATSGHCIGVGYVLGADGLNIYLSTPRPAAGQMERFAAELPATLRELAALLAGGS